MDTFKYELSQIGKRLLRDLARDAESDNANTRGFALIAQAILVGANLIKVPDLNGALKQVATAVDSLANAVRRHTDLKDTIMSSYHK